MLLLAKAILICCIALSSQQLWAEQALHITALLSHDKTPYHQVLEGLQGYFNEHEQPVDLQVIHNLQIESYQLQQQVITHNPNVLLTLGQQATEFAVEHFKHIPICASMLLNSNSITHADNATALTLTFSLQTELEWLAKLLKDRGRIAILYNPVKNTAELQALQQLADSYQLPVFLQAVPNNTVLSELLNQLPRDTAALWSFTDSSILTAQTAKPLLLYSFRNRIPLVGISAQWVKAGALYALERDYVDIGRQCAEKIIKIQRGTHIKQLPIETPRKALYILNKKTAEHMKIDLPADILAGAYEIF